MSIDDDCRSPSPASTLPSLYTRQPHPHHLTSHDGCSQHPQQHRPVGHPRRATLLPGTSLHLRRQRRHPRSDLRPPRRRQRRSRQRRHPLPDPLATKEHHLRRTYQATEHLHHDRQQGSPDGELNAPRPPPTGSPAITQDLSGTPTLPSLSPPLSNLPPRTSAKTTTNGSFPPSATKSSNRSSRNSTPPN
jgi:hypothetical protein